MKALHFFDSSVKNNPGSRRQKPADINPQRNHCVKPQISHNISARSQKFGFQFYGFGFYCIRSSWTFMQHFTKNLGKKCLLRDLGVCENNIKAVFKTECIHQPAQWLPCCAHSTESDHGGNCMNNWATASFSTNRIHIVGGWNWKVV